MEHFEWIEGISLFENIRHVVYMGLSMMALSVIIGIARYQMKKGKGGGLFLESSLSIKTFFDHFLSLIVGLSDLVIGEKGRPFVPLFCTLFLFIWCNNLMGLVPGMGASTGNVNTTLALGTFSFLAYNFIGFKEHGISYLKQLMGPVLLLAPLLFVIELISHFVRPLSLGLRLYGNMLGDHTVLGIFLNLVPFFIPVLFYFLGLFVCTMQAFIFTILSMVYVSIAVSHDH